MSVNVEVLQQTANNLLQPVKFSDYCFNGLQVPNSGQPVHHILAAVSASKTAILAAAKAKADVLLVHHGLFWQKDELRLTNIIYQRVRDLIKHDIALLAYHLPLDEHNVYGNNALLGNALGIESDLQKDLGLMAPSLGRYADVLLSVSDLKLKLEQIMQRSVQHFDFGPETIKRLAWCTGAAQDGIEVAKAIGADAYISGEVSEKTFHLAQELGLHYFTVGHHASERFGVKALAEVLAKTHGLTQSYFELGNPV